MEDIWSCNRALPKVFGGEGAPTHSFPAQLQLPWTIKVLKL